MAFCVSVVYASILATTTFSLTEARGSAVELLNFQMKVMSSYLGNDHPLDPSNVESYVLSSPYSLPPFESLPPLLSPEYTPPPCLYPPCTTAQPPYTDPPFISSPAGKGPSPPTYLPVPNPPQNVPNPPTIIPTPPYLGPFSPPKHVPSPPVYQTPVVYPPPTVPPPPHKEPQAAAWCVAKPTVPDPIIQEAMDYACGTGADCKSIEPNGPCFEPNTLFSHASYAFNSYWQNSKVAGGTCDFGGSAILVTLDPSFEECQFNYN